eukprot:2037865-Rhodomonas_salina.3
MVREVVVHAVHVASEPPDPLQLAEMAVPPVRDLQDVQKPRPRSQDHQRGLVLVADGRLCFLPASEPNSAQFKQPCRCMATDEALTVCGLPWASRVAHDAGGRCLGWHAPVARGAIWRVLAESGPLRSQDAGAGRRERFGTDARPWVWAWPWLSVRCLAARNGTPRTRCRAARTTRSRTPGRAHPRRRASRPPGSETRRPTLLSGNPSPRQLRRFH